MIPSEFPPSLKDLWGKSVTAKANITHRAVIEVEDKKGNKTKMPVLETVDLEIEGYHGCIPRAVVMSPAFWRSKARVLDTIQFQGVLIREKGRYIGFRMIHDVHVIPFQTSLTNKNEGAG